MNQMNMTRQEFDTIIDAFLKEARDTMNKKRADYTSKDANVYANFVGTAMEEGLKPIQVLRIFMRKHWSSIETFRRFDSVESEPIRSRFIDLINYLLLEYAYYHMLQHNGAGGIPYVGNWIPATADGQTPDTSA